MTAPKPEKLFNDIAGFIAESRKLLDEGALLELSGLDQQVRALCEEVEKLSDENREQYAGRMQQLFTDLKDLEDAMLKMRDALGEDMRALSDRQKANVAYRTASANKKYEDKK